MMTAETKTKMFITYGASFRTKKDTWAKTKNTRTYMGDLHI